MKEPYKEMKAFLFSFLAILFLIFLTFLLLIRPSPTSQIITEIPNETREEQEFTKIGYWEITTYNDQATNEYKDIIENYDFLYLKGKIPPILCTELRDQTCQTQENLTIISKEPINQSTNTLFLTSNIRKEGTLYAISIPLTQQNDFSSLSFLENENRNKNQIAFLTIQKKCEEGMKTYEGAWKSIFEDQKKNTCEQSFATKTTLKEIKNEEIYEVEGSLSNKSILLLEI